MLLRAGSKPALYALALWLKDYMGATGPEPYLKAVSRKFLIAMVARVFEPGVKFDTMLVLEGAQGIGKSTAGRILATDEWYCDTITDIRDKDAMLNLQGAWVVENPELATLKRSDLESYKAFFSKQIDRVRAPYGERWQEHRRQCVFIGTTNAEDYLIDKTGNRRFWPVRVKQLNFARLIEDREQLLAEALFEFGLGEDLHLTGLAEEQAKEVQSLRVAPDEEDMFREQFTSWLKKELPTGEKLNMDRFSLSELFDRDGYGPWKEYGSAIGHKGRIAARVLRSLGFSSRKTGGNSGWRKAME